MTETIFRLFSGIWLSLFADGETMALIKGKKEDPEVREVFEFLIHDFMVYDEEFFSPEKVLKQQGKQDRNNYPEDIRYADMTGIEGYSGEREASVSVEILKRCCGSGGEEGTGKWNRILK